MRKIILYIATSLDGKIADKDGGVDWLESIPVPENTDYGYSDFYKSIEITLMGRKTYQQVIDWGIDFPYAGKKNYVITRQQGLENTEYVDFISSNHIEFIRQLKEQEGKDIWLIGGGHLNSMLLKDNLIDEIRMHIMPIILTEGIDLFTALPGDFSLKLKSSKPYTNGVLELIYEPVGKQSVSV